MIHSHSLMVGITLLFFQFCAHPFEVTLGEQTGPYRMKSRAHPQWLALLKYLLGC